MECSPSTGSTPFLLLDPRLWAARGHTRGGARGPGEVLGLRLHPETGHRQHSGAWVRGRGALRPGGCTAGTARGRNPRGQGYAVALAVHPHPAAGAGAKSRQKAKGRDLGSMLHCEATIQKNREQGSSDGSMGQHKQLSTTKKKKTKKKIAHLQQERDLHPLPSSCSLLHTQQRPACHAQGGAGRGARGERRPHRRRPCHEWTRGQPPERTSGSGGGARALVGPAGSARGRCAAGARGFAPLFLKARSAPASARPWSCRHRKVL